MDDKRFGVRSAGLFVSSDAAVSDSIKAALDVVLVLLALPLVIPVITILYIATRLDGGPGFFGHMRVGRDGRPFRCWKIRTMVPDAEAALAQYLERHPGAAAQWKREFKLDDDPRITPLGTFLRSTSLDELPQVWNVLRGEMSLVGPRPITPEELAHYRGYEWCYLSVKPGITGVWQVSGRNDVSYAERVQMDVEYLRSRSLMLDLSLIMKTVGAVLKRTGK